MGGRQGVVRFFWGDEEIFPDKVLADMAKDVTPKGETMAKNKHSCEFCTHYGADSSTQGRCTRYPPQVMMSLDPQGRPSTSGAFPPTMGTNGCGEWEQGSMIKSASILPFSGADPEAN